MTGIAVGLTKGHVVSRRKLASRPGQRKGVCRISCLFLMNHALQSAFVCNLRFIFPVVTSRDTSSQKLGKRVKMIRELVRDVAGSAPYEKRLMELLKVGRDKRALKLAKRKVRRLLGFCSNFLVRTTRTQT